MAFRLVLKAFFNTRRKEHDKPKVVRSENYFYSAEISSTKTKPGLPRPGCQSGR